MHFSSRFSRGAQVVAAFSALALGLSACSDSGSESASTTTQDAAASGDEVNIVASTSVWADVAQAVTDDARVHVTPIIQGTDIDPHHFEPTAADMAKASEADIVVANGGGYDSWLYEPLQEKPEGEDPTIVHPLELVAHEHHHDHGEAHDHDHGEAHDHDHGDAHDHDHGEAHDHDHGDAHDHDNVDASQNEHIWYDPNVVASVAEDVAEAITQKNPDIKVDPARVAERLDGLHEDLHQIEHVRVAQTEPIADHMIVHTDVDEVTPAGYRQATLNESEPSAADLAEFLELIDSDGLDLLIYNPQTETDLTARIKQTAQDKGLTIIEIPETPPAGIDFLDHLENTVKELVQKASEAGKH